MVFENSQPETNSGGQGSGLNPPSLGSLPTIQEGVPLRFKKPKTEYQLLFEKAFSLLGRKSPESLFHSHTGKLNWLNQYTLVYGQLNGGYSGHNEDELGVAIACGIDPPKLYHCKGLLERMELVQPQSAQVFCNTLSHTKLLIGTPQMLRDWAIYANPWVEDEDYLKELQEDGVEGMLTKDDVDALLPEFFKDEVTLEFEDMEDRVLGFWCSELHLRDVDTYSEYTSDGWEMSPLVMLQEKDTEYRIIDDYGNSCMENPNELHHAKVCEPSVDSILKSFQRLTPYLRLIRAADSLLTYAMNTYGDC